MATKKKGVTKKKVPSQEEAEGKETTGVFGVDEDAEAAIAESNRAAQEQLDDEITGDFLGHGIVMGGIELRPVTFSDLAILQQAGSVFTNFTPILTEDERKRMLDIAKKDEAGKKLTKKEVEDFQTLSSAAMQELSMVENTYMEVLKFFAIMDAQLSSREASDLVFGDPEGVKLRHAAIEIGSAVKITNFSSMSKEIAMLIRDVQKTRVEPRPDKDNPSKNK